MNIGYRNIISFVFTVSIAYSLCIFISFAADDYTSSSLEISESYVDYEIEVLSNGRCQVVGSSNVLVANILPNESISGFTDILTSKQNSKWILNISSKDSVNISLIKIKLPQGVVINAVKSSLSSNIALDDSIVVTFIGKNEPISIAIQYSLTQSEEGIGNLVRQENSKDIALYLIIAAALLTLIGISTWIYKTKFKATPNVLSTDISKEKLESIRHLLNETQNKIVDALMNSGGAATQNKIHHMTGIPKASLSRNIAILDQKQIVKKREGGYTNQILLGAKLSGQPSSTVTQDIPK